MTALPRETGAGPDDLAEVRARVAARVVGRARELDLLLAAVAAGRDVLLEGPPGTSKSTVLGAITAEWDVPLVFVEGNADLTPTRLVGHHSPSRVLREDYSADTFVAGPLVEAMRSGGFLYVEEFNRAPEDTLNTLLTAMAERRLAVPGRDRRRGAVVPRRRDDEPLRHRRHHPALDVGQRPVVPSRRRLPGRRAERAIVTARTDLDCPRLVADAVALTRATRDHEAIRQGSSVRGAIDLALVVDRLARLRTTALPSDPSVDPPRDLPAAYTELVLDGMLLALSGRIHLDEVVETTPEDVLREIWTDHFVLDPARAEPG